MQTELSRTTRDTWLRKLNGRYFDVCVIGGGITGAGIANLLSANGISVLLIDKGDFASGTSSYSSKLIHGGIRYLQQGRLLLTRELLKERNYLIKNADFVNKEEFHILIDNYSWNPWTIRVGLFIYELIGGNIRMPLMNKKGYNYEGFKGYFSYTDAISDDAYLTVNNIVSAAMNGAMVINYCEAKSLQEAEGNTLELLLEDKIGGKIGRATCKVIINATGPWINETLKRFTGKEIKNFKLSKGSHLISTKIKYIKNPIAFKSHLDRRQMFVIPREQTMIIGTTDKFVESPDDFNIDDEDRDYIFKSVRRIMPDLKESDILRGYAGIRPLYGKGKSPGRVTRDFHIELNDKIISVMGVKITNYRNAARNVAPYIQRLISRPISTGGLPQLLYERPKEGNIIQNIVRYEMPVKPEDIILRRMGLYFTKLDGGKSYVESIKKELDTY